MEGIELHGVTVKRDGGGRWAAQFQLLRYPTKSKLLATLCCKFDRVSVEFMNEKVHNTEV